jgi:hypothetical protein
MPHPRRSRKRVPAPGRQSAVPEPDTHGESSAQNLPEGKAERARLVPVPEKVGEGKNNLRGRSNAFKRRRGTTS